MKRSCIAIALLALPGCGDREAREVPAVEGSASNPNCPSFAPAPSPLPGVDPREESLAEWLSLSDPAELDRPLLDEQSIERLNRAHESNGSELPFTLHSLASPPPRDQLERALAERLTYLRERLERGELLDARGERIGSEASRLYVMPAALTITPDPRIALRRISLRCGPAREPLYSTTLDSEGRPTPLRDRTFDRNACSAIEAQDPLFVLGRFGDMLLVRTRFALGFIPAEAPLSSSVPPEEWSRYVQGPRARAKSTRTLDSGSHTLEVTPETSLPADATGVFFATADSFEHAPLPSAERSEERRPLTRRAFLTEAFERLGQPYGWGGSEGLDCSELVMDVLSSFGLDLPRNSARQAEAGSFAIDISEEASHSERLALIETAAAHGIAILHLPGHTMIWLGRNRQGEPRILHAFAEYAEPCEGGGETIRRAMRVAVSSLSLGEGSSRRSLLERLTRVTIFGRQPSPPLSAIATARPAAPVSLADDARCEDSLDLRIFSSPMMPHAEAPLRIVITSSKPLGPHDIAIRDPERNWTHHVPSVRLGGPPFTEVVEIERPSAGTFTLVVGEGAEVRACDRIAVARNPRDASEALPLPIGGGPSARMSTPGEAFWIPRWSWEEDTENFYSAFVEQLFAYPEGDQTWSSLTELLASREHNLLFNHLGQNEESSLELIPDCADLPYFLRAYFAWKLRLPFAFRRCTRGRAGEPPACGELLTTDVAHRATNEAEAFRGLIEGYLRAGVHSASGRTAPGDEATDLYPIALSRESLRPGTVFVDPYGHLLVLAGYRPQRPGGAGALFGADAQPDGTIGRRTFWRGTFLFTPDTRDVGAGWKAFRPVRWDRRTDAWSVLANPDLTRRSQPYSREQ